MDGGSSNIVQVAMIKIIPKKKKSKKTKWFSKEALQIADKRREAKGKGEKEIYIIWMQSSKEQEETKWSMQRTRGKQQKGKD